MSSFLKKQPSPKSKGSFLIEILLAVIILSVGILTVMQVFAVQARAAGDNRRKTDELFLMTDHLGAVLSNVDPDELDTSEDKERGTVRVSSRTCTDEKEGLKEMTLVYESTGVSAKEGISLVTYVEKDAAAL